MIVKEAVEHRTMQWLKEAFTPAGRRTLDPQLPSVHTQIQTRDDAGRTAGLLHPCPPDTTTPLHTSRSLAHQLSSWPGSNNCGSIIRSMASAAHEGTQSIHQSTKPIRQSSPHPWQQKLSVKRWSTAQEQDQWPLLPPAQFNERGVQALLLRLGSTQICVSVSSSRCGCRMDDGWNLPIVLAVAAGSCRLCSCSLHGKVRTGRGRLGWWLAVLDCQDLNMVKRWSSSNWHTLDHHQPCPMVPNLVPTGNTALPLFLVNLASYATTTAANTKQIFGKLLYTYSSMVSYLSARKWHRRLILFPPCACVVISFLAGNRDGEGPSASGK